MRTTHRWQVDTGADQQQEAPTLERRPYITRPAPEGGNSWKSQDQQSGPAPEEVENITRRAPDGGNSSGESGAGLKLFQTGEPAQLEHFIQRLENGDASIFFKPIFSTLFCAHSRRWCEERGPYITKSMRQCWTDSTSARHDNHLHSESVGQLPFDL